MGIVARGLFIAFYGVIPKTPLDPNPGSVIMKKT
jgi:hypothetical protein